MEQLKTVHSNFLDVLKQFIKSEVIQALQDCLKELPKESDEYLTIKQTCKYIKVSEPTLWDWSNKGILCKHYIAGQPRYKKSEVDGAFLKLIKSKGGANE